MNQCCESNAEIKKLLCMFASGLITKTAYDASVTKLMDAGKALNCCSLTIKGTAYTSKREVDLKPICLPTSIPQPVQPIPVPPEWSSKFPAKQAIRTVLPKQSLTQSMN
jgi:hypothetical protein